MTRREYRLFAKHHSYIIRSKYIHIENLASMLLSKYYPNTKNIILPFKIDVLLKGEGIEYDSIESGIEKLLEKYSSDMKKPTKYSKVEIDYFFNCFTMPKKLFDYFDQKYLGDVEKISKEFDVTIEQAKGRQDESMFLDEIEIIETESRINNEIQKEAVQEIDADGLSQLLKRS